MASTYASSDTLNAEQLTVFADAFRLGRRPEHSVSGDSRPRPILIELVGWSTLHTNFLFERT